MYEDNRKIEATGLLSQGTKTYTPKPIALSFNDASKPAADHVNRNKEQMKQERIQKRQLDQQERALQMQEAGLWEQKNAGGGGKVICTKYYEHGYLDEHIYAADSAMGDRLIVEQPDFVAWYWSWGMPFVTKVIHGKTRLSRFYLWIGSPLCKAWAKEMAYQVGSVPKGSVVGKWMMSVGIAVFNRSKYAKDSQC